MSHKSYRMFVMSCPEGLAMQGDTAKTKRERLASTGHTIFKM